MDVKTLWFRLLSEGVGVWLDGGAKLRIDSDASPEMKQAVRDNKALVTGILMALQLVNDSSIRPVRVVGGYALAKPPGDLTPELLAALGLLGMDGLPLVHNTEGRRWVGYETWRRKQVTAGFDRLSDADERQRWFDARQAERDDPLRTKPKQRRSA